MNGQDAYTALSNTSPNMAVFLYAKQVKDDENSETLAVACQIILNDSDLLVECEDKDDLQKVIIDKAERLGEYAGLPYRPEAFLEPTNPRFLSEDTGLSWVNFSDLWDTLIWVADRIDAGDYDSHMYE